MMTLYRRGITGDPRREEPRVRNEQMAAERRRVVAGGNSLECPICHDEQINCPVDTNCNHTFCARCILDWCCNYQSTCPVCRRKVTLLMGSEQWNSHNTQQVFRQVDNYNQHHQNERGYLASLFDLPALYQHFWRDYFRIGVIPVTAKCYFFFLAVILILYLLSPLDLIPEMVFGIIGLIDDVGAIVLMVLYVAEQYRTHIINAGHG